MFFLFYSIVLMVATGQRHYTIVCHHPMLYVSLHQCHAIIYFCGCALKHPMNLSYVICMLPHMELDFTHFISQNQ
jgi:hypothetical protein